MTSQIAPVVVLEPTTATGLSDSFMLYNDNTNVTITCDGLNGGEIAGLEYYDAIAESWKPYNVDGIQKRFSVSNNKIVIYDEFGTYRINKGITAQAVGVYIQQYKNRGII